MHDPIATQTVSIAAHREPVFQHAEQADAARRKLAEFTARTGRAPNVLVVLMDDVGWGDFGCYGGGVAVGAPTPHIDRLAAGGLRLTSCYSEPSCTPSRASLLTGRLPMRHGLQRPPMYGEKGGLQGEITLAQLLGDAGYVTQAVGKWHLGENVESQPQNVGFDDFYGFLSVSDMYTEWRDPYFFPEIVYNKARTQWIENQPFNRCFVHAAKGGQLENVEEVTIPVLSLLDDQWATYSIDFLRRMAGTAKPWFLYHCTRGAHFDNYPHERFLGTSPAKHCSRSQEPTHACRRIATSTASIRPPSCWPPTVCRIANISTTGSAARSPRCGWASTSSWSPRFRTAITTSSTRVVSPASARSTHTGASTICTSIPRKRAAT